MSVSIDPTRIPRTYRDYLDTLKEMGELVEINDEVDWYLELGAIFRRTQETLSPGAIFNKVKGCPEGFRAADFGMAKSGRPGQPWARLAVMFGLAPDTDLMSIQRAYLEAMETGKSHPPRMVDAASAPCKQNKWLGDDIDITKFPAPVGHAGDGGRYIQTAGINIVRTPDGKWTNWSTNRGMIVDRNHMTGLWLPAQHNGQIYRMWKKEGKDTPWACAFGVSPAVTTQSASRCPDWVDEYDRASALLDDGIEMVKCETNDLLVPADSEIVLEGLVSHSEVEVEGPFGEYPGYLPETTAGMPRQTITAVTFRNDPILPISLPGVPTDNCHISMGFFMSADIVVALRKAGIPVIDAMMTFESAMHWLVVRVPTDWHDSTGLSVDDFINKIGNSFWGTHVGDVAAKILVVGEDIDPADPNAVTWAFATRNHPKLGLYLFPELESMGGGLEHYLSVNDHLRGKGGLAIYSCLPLQERIGLPRLRHLSFKENYPKAIQEKVRSNWARWGFEKSE
ncbi:MAG: UbiD family decarboxylase [Candidatus Krumholzibacteria bacterium]|nr:UbiD family decarboxylase [Candidatus Krumholzibacteria bacterium]